MHFKHFASLVALLLILPARAETPTTAPAAPKLAVEGFPIAVWLQDPRNVDAYKNIGITIYEGLWDGPTEKQLATLQKAHMKVICEQNAESLKPAWKDTVIAFMHGDEPDNAQEIPGGKGYGPPILPSKILEGYKKLKAADPRPVLLNLGQGVAWDGYIGRGTRTNKPEDYAEYVQGCDLASFDIYPACHENKAIAGKLQYVGTGTASLKTWAAGRPVWACIETTHIGNPKAKATPEQVRSEVFMAIANGATGITYFAHEFQPKFVEAGLLADKDMAAAVKKINAEVQSLAGPIMEGEGASSAKIECPELGAIKTLQKQWKNATYLIIVEMAADSHTVTLTIPAGQRITALADTPPTSAADGKCTLELKNYAVGIFKIGG